MGEYFPNEIKAIEKYINLIFSVNKVSAKFYIEKLYLNHELFLVIILGKISKLSDQNYI